MYISKQALRPFSLSTLEMIAGQNLKYSVDFPRANKSFYKIWFQSKLRKKIKSAKKKKKEESNNFDLT